MDVAKGALAGLAGGIAGTWAMNHFQRWWSQAVQGQEPQSAAGRHDARDWQELAEGRNANEIAAQTIAKHTVGRSLDQRELEVGATMVHFVFGGAMGALYGALWEVSPATRRMGGAAFGIAVWAAADEVAVPLLGLSRPTTEHPPERHAHAFAAHIVFGMTIEIVRRGVRAMLPRGKRQPIGGFAVNRPVERLPA
jgi:putative membrane protein